MFSLAKPQAQPGARATVRYETAPGCCQREIFDPPSEFAPFKVGQFNAAGNTGVVLRIARQLGIGVETLRHWVNQAEIDGGFWPGMTSSESEALKAAHKEIREPIGSQIAGSP